MRGKAIAKKQSAYMLSGSIHDLEKRGVALASMMITGIC
jgi:hypothetical protein